jgi:hypothetical protein
VREQVVQRDAALVGGHAGKEAPDRVADREPAVHREPQDRRGRELLGDGPDVERRARAERRAALPIREAVPACEHHRVAVRHEERSREAVAAKPVEVAVRVCRARCGRALRVGRAQRTGSSEESGEEGGERSRRAGEPHAHGHPVRRREASPRRSRIQRGRREGCAPGRS